MKYSDLEIEIKRARAGRFTCVAEQKCIPYPWRSITSRRISFAVANTYTLSAPTGTYNVVIAARQRTTTRDVDVEVWCGDQFLEGRGLSSEQALERSRMATEEQDVPNAEQVQQRMLSHFGSLEQASECNFWQLKRRKPAQLCAHTQHVLATLFSIEDFMDMSQALDDYLTGRITSEEESADEGLLQRLMFRVPVLLEGDRGSGKTYEAHSFAREHDAPLIEVAGHEGVEAMDLLGSFVPMADRSLVWKDGPVSQAFRMASKGRPAVLLIDELLRIPTRQQSVLLTALSPIDGHYRLRTGRIVKVEDGVGEEEVLRCEVKNLAVVATTNVGADYALDQLDPAIAERWVILRKDTTEEGLRGILSKVVADREFPEGLVGRLVRFFTKMRELHNVEQIARLPTTRTLVRAVELAEQVDDVPEMLNHQALLWTERNLDGYPVKEQIDTVRKAVASTFPRGWAEA